jgi:glucokinase
MQAELVLDAAVHEGLAAMALLAGVPVDRVASKAGASAIAAAPDRNAMISRIGTQSKRGAAKLTIDLFVSLYGAETGNLALKTFSTSGVYIAGNIAGHLAPQLQSGAFTDAMRAKGRLSRLLETMPVALVKGTDHGLTGSAAFAAASLPE